MWMSRKGIAYTCSRKHATVTEDLELNLTLQEDSKISLELHHCDPPQSSATSVKS